MAPLLKKELIMEVKQDFKSFIQNLRNSLGKTQKEIYQNVGISRKCYRQYEYGQRVPNAKVAVKIAHALETTVEDIWGREAKMP